MRRRADVTIQILTLLILWVSPLPLFAQTANPPSLKEQLEAQYLQPGTVLVIQKAGILGIPATSKTTCATRYQGGKLTPDASCTAPKNNSKPLTVGEKVYLSKIEVDVAEGKISFRIGECDSCNKVDFSSRISRIDFQFANLKKASVTDIEDTISEVLAFQEVADQQPPQTPSPPEQQGEQTPGVLTNNDVVKMAKVKLGDDIIISTIKSSQCNFDTSVDGMVKLKTAGVSDAVIQAMRDTQQPASTAENQPAPSTELQPDATPAPAPAPAPGQSFSVRHRHGNAAGWFVQGANTEYYCSGTLSVSPDGTVAYDCAQTDDPSGRCEHLSFAPGSLKQVKIGLSGNLHLEGKTQDKFGKFDFYGGRDDIKQAQAAIAPLIQTTQK